jgi:hypothetical protein
VSPANKDRDETRRAFIAKCAAYLQRGIGLIVVDIRTYTMSCSRFSAVSRARVSGADTALRDGISAGAPH